ncbi:hypothetical protein RHMOL_Rhmol10G0117000 [Rhododendron molle]|uniref:Uncharacterized protein n=1 Tax=Rhododendron molle TaxID=49168 RepID=A0ACC0M2B9_RHOML|nr:hypothetical protein RHMOL_Rhmol10G0117000 [Rhododendron molle]
MESRAVNPNYHASPLRGAFRLLLPRISTDKMQFCPLPLMGLQMQFKKKLLFASYSKHDSTDQDAVITRSAHPRFQ